MSNPTSDPDRPKRSPNPRLKTASTLVALPGSALGGTTTLQNLSTTGARVEIQVVEEQVAFEKGQTLQVRLANPKLPRPLTLPAEVMWKDEEGQGSVPGRTFLGVRFSDPKQADAALRPFLTAEAGSCVFKEETLLGFLVPHGKAMTTWSLFDVSGKRLAVAARNDAGYEVRVKTKRAGSLPWFQVATLSEAVCKSIGVELPFRLDPSVPELGPKGAPRGAKAVGEPTSEEGDAPEPPSKAMGRSVSTPAGSLGFICEAELPDCWLVVDLEGTQLAYLAGSEGSSEYQVCSMGDAIDDDLEFRMFPDLRTAVGVAFRLGDSAEGVELGELKPVGEVAPVVVKDSASSVDLGPGAVKITLQGYPTAEEARPRPNKKSKAPKTTKPLRVRLTWRERASRYLPRIVIVSLGLYLAYGFYKVLNAYTS